MPTTVSNNSTLREIIYTHHKSFKADGERTFLVHKEGHLWSYNRTLNILYLPFSLNTEDFIIDCELLGEKYLAFDIPSESKKGYKERRERLEELVKYLKVFDPSLFSIKEEEDISRTSDGIIFTSLGKYSDPVYKTKPQPTIDISIPVEKEMEEVVKEWGWNFSNVENPGIYEVNSEGKILRRRFDKSTPNPPSIIKKTLSDKSWIEYEEIMKREKMQMMRYHHNKIKDGIISRLRGLLIDVGSGQGGDISKWVRNKKLKKVVAVEPDKGMAEEFRKRVKRSGGEKIKLLNKPLDPSFSLDNCDKPRNMTMFFCLSQVMVNFKEGGELTKLLKKLDVQSVHIINMFEEDVLYESNERWSIRKYNEKRMVDIRETRAVKIKEEKTSWKEFGKIMEEGGYHLREKCVLSSPPADCFTHEEETLNRMYSYSHFSKALSP